MELFIVNRYDPENKIDSTGNAESIKRKLLKRIEKRKHYLSTSVNSTSELDESINVSNHEASVNIVESQEAEIRKKHKKKKKTEEDIQLSSQVQEQEQEQEPSVVYKVLGKDSSEEKAKIKRVLPYWLARPSVVSVDLKNLSHDVDSIPKLDKKLVELLKKNNVTHFFPVQDQVIPWLLETLNKPSMYWPNDVCVSAPTGSGKTLAFVLPIIQALYKKLNKHIRVLVVLPVQDLAKQVFKVFHCYAEPLGVKTILLSNAVSFQLEQKHLIRKDKCLGFRSLVDVVITTPGRLVDHLKGTVGFDLKHLQYLVIDEADRVMEGVQNDWLYHLNSHIGLSKGISTFSNLTIDALLNNKRPPQKLLFSATLSQDPEKLQQLSLFQPKLFTSVVTKNNEVSERLTGEFVGKFTTPAELDECFVICSSLSYKPLVLHYLIENTKWRGVLCFTKSKQGAYRLAILLRHLSHGKLRVSQISSDISNTRRDSIIKKFTSGLLDVLVCSDALARGIDIAGVKYVVSYDVPKYIKNYVHRIGRTGRAGQEGTAVTLLLPKEVSAFRSMTAAAGKSSIREVNVNEKDLEGYLNTYANSLEAVKKKLGIANALKKGVKNRKGNRKRNKLKVNAIV